MIHGVSPSCASAGRSITPVLTFVANTDSISTGDNCEMTRRASDDSTSAAMHSLPTSQWYSFAIALVSTK